MSTTIDNKVVEMRFDNQQFERNANQSISTLDKLKRALTFKKSSKGLDDLEKKSKSVNLNALAKSVDALSGRFNTLGIVGITALQRITNAAITTGKRITAALTIDPVKTGLQEYETKIGAIQVIRANDTAASMDQISAALNELNTYADKTIYNFAQMTSNVGKFVAQGLGVEEAANAVKGMANLAAASGASPSDMARATYQMSQALGGVIRKIDVNSLRNANMWTMTLKDTLIDIARAEGVAIDEMIAEKGTLEETLEEGWLTGKMFTKAMNIYSGVYNDAQLQAMGFNDEQIEKFKAIAKTAEEAATEVKTFTQLIDTLKEAVQSGWTQSWENLIGNFEEAKQLWTAISNVLNEFVEKSANARNMTLGAWKALGGRDTLIKALGEAFENLLLVITPIKKAFDDLFPPITAINLNKLTRAFRRFIIESRPTQDILLAIYNAAHGLFSILKAGVTIIKSILSALSPTLGVLSNIVGFVIKLAGVLGYLVSLGVEILEQSGVFVSIGNAVANVVFTLFGAIGKLVSAIVYLISEIASLPIVQEIFSSISNGLANLVALIGGYVEIAKQFFANLIYGIQQLKREDLEPYLNTIAQLIEFIWNKLLFVKDVFLAFIGVVVAGFSKLISLKDNLGSIGDWFKELGNRLEEINNKNTEKVKKGFEGLAAAMQRIGTFVKTTGQKILTWLKQIDYGKVILIGFAGAIIYLMTQIGRFFGSIPSLVANVSKTFKALIKAIKSFEKKDSIGNTILKIALAIAILSGSLAALTLVDSNKLMSVAKALGVFVGALVLIAVAMGAVSIFDKTGAFSKNVNAIVGLAAGVGILAVSLKLLEGMKLWDILKGLYAIGNFFTLLVLYTGILAALVKDFSKGSQMILFVAASVMILSKALVNISAIPVDQMRAAFDVLGQSMLLLVALTKVAQGLKFGSGAGVMALASSILVLQIALLAIAKFGPNLDLIKANIDKYVIVFGALAGLMLMTRAAGQYAAGAGAAALLMSISLGVLVGVIGLLGAVVSLVGGDALLAGIIGLVGLVVVLRGMFWAIAEAKEGAAKASLALIPMSVALTLLGGVATLLGVIPPDALIRGLGAIWAMSAMMSMMVKASEHAKGVDMKPIIAIVAGIGVLAVSLAVLSFADPGTLFVAAVSLASVLFTFAEAIRNASELTKGVSIAPILTMIGGIIGATAALYILATMPWEGLLAAGVALSIVMLAMTKCINMAYGSMEQAGALTIMSVGIIALAGALKILSTLSLQELGIALLGLAGGLLVLVGIGALAGYFPLISAGLGGLALALQGIAVAVVIFGAAAIEFAYAANLMSTALMNLSTISSEGATNITNAINAVFVGIGQGVANMIVTFFDTLVDGISKGIDRVADTIASKAPLLGKVGGVLMEGLKVGLLGAIGGPVGVVIGLGGKLVDAIKGRLPDMHQAGTDMALGLAEGVDEGVGIGAEAGAKLGEGTMDGFREETGWHSPWKKLLAAMKDAGQALLDGAPLGEVLADAAGKMIGDAAVDGTLGEIYGRAGELQEASNFLGEVLARYKDTATKENSGNDIEKEEFLYRRGAHRQAYDKREAARKAKEEEEKKQFGGSSGGGGGGGSGASTATKEVKKLFDVLEDGKKVIEAFQENFASAYEQIGDTEKFDIAKDSVQKLAEAIYAESVKSVDAATQAAKTSEEKLAEMRDAFISFSDGIKTSISNAIDEFGKFSIGKSTFGSIKDWQKSLDDQKNGLLAWDRELRRFAKRTDNYNLYEMVLKWGPERLSDLRILNSATDKEFKRISESMVEVMGDGVNSLSEVITNNALANAAFIFEEAHKTTEDTEEAVEESLEEASEAVAKVTDNTVGRFVTTTKNGYAVVSASQASVVKGQNSFTESIKDTIKVTDQLKAKALSIYDDVSSSIESALTGSQSFFEKFDTESELTGTDLIDAAKSNNKTFEEWGNMMSELMFRGIDTKLAEELYSAGIDSYDKVKAIYEMDESELEQYNMLYKKFQELPKSISDQVGEAAAAAGVMLANGFVNSFSIDPAYNQAKEYALATVRALKEGVEDPVNGAASVAKATAEATGNGIKDNTDIVNRAALEAMNNSVVVWEAHAKEAFKVVGAASMAGMAEGVSENAYRVVNAFGDVTESGVNETEEGLDINSPSKVFAKIGEYCMLGFANGIADNSDKVSGSAIDSMKAIVGHIADIINGEVQVDPTIRPVMDLSGIDDGVSAIDSMFGGRSYALSRGINIQNRTDSMNDMMSQMAANQAAMIQNSNRAPINMYVYAAPGQSEQEIADIVEQKFMARFNSGRAVWT